MTTRTVHHLIKSMPASDGAGVKLRRSLGQSPHARLDPFLMLDEFSSEDAADYIAGFPAHPHRGFETVTYILDGHMLHEDHLGNKGNLKSGGVQWMTAARGIIHSEMPQQDRGRMRGFQLWINLPAKDKMKPASYRDLEAGDIPEVKLGETGKVRVIAGNYAGTAAPVKPGATDATYLDVHLPAGAKFGFLGDDRGLRAGRKRCGGERGGKQPDEFPCTRGRDQRRFKLSMACSDVDARSTGAANGRHVAIPRSRPSPSRKPTRGNGGTESGRKRGRMRSGTVSTAQFGSSVVIVSQELASSPG